MAFFVIVFHTPHFITPLLYQMSDQTKQDRLTKAKQIASNPVAYKVCEGCDSIVGCDVVICPNCHGYRFDADPTRVVDQALELGTREQRSVTAEDLG